MAQGLECCTAVGGVLANRAIFAGFQALRSALREDRSLICISRAWALDRDEAEPQKLPQPKARGVKGEGTIVSGMAGRDAPAVFELSQSERGIATAPDEL